MEPYVRGAGGQIFVWRLLRLTGLHDLRCSNIQNNTVELGREFHADILFWKWATENEILLPREALSAPCYTATKRLAKRHYLSDARFEAVGGFCVEKKVCRRYDFPGEPTIELKRKADSWGDTYRHDQPVTVTGTGCDSVVHART